MEPICISDQWYQKGICGITLAAAPGQVWQFSEFILQTYIAFC
jgi:hypothetical protein